MNDNFELVGSWEIPDCASTGFYFRHKKTGLEVFHLLNNDAENLFGFSFRTPNAKSNGAAHIIEHSVFCGSEKYPYKDPFVILENQSVHTFLNALTFPDKTVYPASSVVPKDYFNLMGVYADAVFFPTLREEIFLQEGRHLEIDAHGRASMQGVVYNEMKGSYSSFINVVGDAIDQALLPDTVYARDSGGDPLEIAGFTYKEFKDFHKKFYSPENCLVFLYGNIPTEKQLDFLQKNVLDKILADKNFSYNKEAHKKFCSSLLQSETQKPFEKMRTSYTLGPSGSGEKGSSALMSWIIGNSDDIDDYAKSIFIGSLLCSHDGSPLSRALLKSGLGKDISDASGTDASERQICFSIGLRGVKKGSEEKVRRFILDEMERISREGVPQEEIESSFNAIDFDNREIKRFQEPFSLVYMRRVLRSWNYGKSPEKCLFVRDAFDRLKKSVLENPDYIKECVKKLFLENNHAVFNVVTPDKKYLQGRAKKEEEIVKRLLKENGREKTLQDTDALHKFQQKEEDDVDAIPHTRPRDLKAFLENYKISRRDIKVNGKDVPLFVSRENTNGIVYFTAAFPMDVFQKEDYPYLPFFAYVLNELGWGKLKWDKASSLIARTCGSFSTTCFSSTCPRSPGAREKLKANRIFAGRQWLFCKIKMLDHKIQDSFDLLRDCILGANFDDKKRMKVLADECLGDLENSVVPNGHVFASMRSECRVNRESAIEESWGGLSQIFSMRKIASDIDGTIVRLKKIAKAVFKSGAVLHITADSSTCTTAIRCAKKFAQELSLCPPVKKVKIPDADLFSMTNLCASDSSKDEMIHAQSMVGFASMTFKASRYATREFVAEKVLAHILTSGVLWEKIRTVGGAYGAFCQTDPINECFTLCTYRDPNPLQSLKAFDECLEEAAKTEYGRDFVEKAVTGTYSSEIQPKSPAGRGTTAFLRELYLIDKREWQEKQRILVTITGEDLQKAAKRLLKNRKNGAKCVVIGPKIEKNSKNNGNFGEIVL